MRIIQTFALGGIAILCFFACTTSTEIATPFVNPPFPELDPEFTTFEYNRTRYTFFELPSGSQLRIPAHAFVDENGQAFSGKAHINYREFHDVANIFLAGIPMDYQQGEESLPFETAGSFEVRATTLQGDDLALQTGKNIHAKLASYESEEDYNFYYLNEEGERWDSTGYAQPIVNEKRVAQKQKIKKMIPWLHFPLNRKYIGLNYDIILDVFLNDKTEGANHEWVKSKMGNYGLRWKNITSYESIVFKGSKHLAGMMVWKNLSGKAFPEWTKDLYAHFEHQQGHTYLMQVASKDSSQHFEARLLAIMPLKDLFAFPPEQWRDNYQATMAKVEVEQERLKLMAEVYREFEVSALGIYNWDRILKMENKVELAASFKFEQEVNEILNELEVIYVSEDNKSIIKYPQYKWNSFPLLPGSKGKFFVLLPGNTVAVFPPEKLAAIDFEALRKSADPSYTFEMKSLQTNFTTAADFRKLIGI